MIKRGEKNIDWKWILIHRDITENEIETNGDTLKKVTEEWSDDIDD